MKKNYSNFPNSSEINQNTFRNLWEKINSLKFNENLSFQKFETREEALSEVDNNIKEVFEKNDALLKEFWLSDKKGLENIWYNYEGFLNNFSDWVKIILAQTIKKNDDWTFEFDFSDSWIENIKNYMDFQTEELWKFWNSYNWKNSEEYKITTKILQNYLNSSIEILSSEIKKNEVPAKTWVDVHKTKKFDIMKWVMTAWISWFMTYWYHKAFKSMIEFFNDDSKNKALIKLKTENPNLGVAELNEIISKNPEYANIWWTLVDNPDFSNPALWWVSVLMTVSVLWLISKFWKKSKQDLYDSKIKRKPKVSKFSPKYQTSKISYNYKKLIWEFNSWLKKRNLFEISKIIFLTDEDFHKNYEKKLEKESLLKANKNLNKKISFSDILFSKETNSLKMIWVVALFLATVEWLWMLSSETSQIYASNEAKKTWADLVLKNNSENKKELDKINDLVSKNQGKLEEILNNEVNNWGYWKYSAALDYLIQWDKEKIQYKKELKQETENLVKAAQTELFNYYKNNLFVRDEIKDFASLPDSFKSLEGFANHIHDIQEKKLNEFNEKIYKTENWKWIWWIYWELEKKWKISRTEFWQAEWKVPNEFKILTDEINKLVENLNDVQSIYSRHFETIQKKWTTPKVIKLDEVPKLEFEKNLLEIYKDKKTLDSVQLWEYLPVFLDMMDKWEYDKMKWYGIIAWVALRSVLLEILAISLIFVSFQKFLNHHRINWYSLEDKKNKIWDYYEKMLDSIHKTFSWEAFRSVFAWYPWITREEADIILKRFLIKKDPTLKEFLIVREEWSQITDRKTWVLNDTLIWLKNSFTSNIKLDDEIFIEKMVNVFDEIWKRAKFENIWEKWYISNISYKDMALIIKEIIPELWSQNLDLIENVYKNFVSRLFEKNILDMEVSKENIKKIVQNNYEWYMISNILESVKSFESEKIKTFLKEKLSWDYKDELEEIIKEIDKKSENWKINWKDIFNIENSENFPFYDLEFLENWWNFKEENTIEKESYKISDFMEIIKENWALDEPFLNWVKNINFEEKEKFLKEVPNNSENRKIIQEELEKVYPHFHDLSKRKEFLEKIEPEKWQEYLEKLPKVSEFLKKFKIISENGKTIKIDKKEFLENAKNIFYDPNLNFSQTVKQIWRNLEDLKHITERSQVAESVLNFEIDSKIISDKIYEFEKLLNHYSAEISEEALGFQAKKEAYNILKNNYKSKNYITKKEMQLFFEQIETLEKDIGEIFYNDSSNRVEWERRKQEVLQEVSEIEFSWYYVLKEKYNNIKNTIESLKSEINSKKYLSENQENMFLNDIQEIKDFIDNFLYKDFLERNRIIRDKIQKYDNLLLKVNFNNKYELDEKYLKIINDTFHLGYFLKNIKDFRDFENHLNNKIKEMELELNPKNSSKQKFSLKNIFRKK